MREILKEKRLTYTDNVVKELEHAAKALTGSFAGENLGKPLVKVS
jgi:NADPH-dependent curcumin reductase CurA